MGHFEKTVNFLQLWPSCILRHCKLYFFAEQKNNIKWRRRRKKIRVWCKKCSFLHHRVTQCTLFRGSLTWEAFFCEESGAGGMRKTESRIPLFFLFFPKPVNQLVLVLKPAKVPKLFPWSGSCCPLNPVCDLGFSIRKFYKKILLLQVKKFSYGVSVFLKWGRPEGSKELMVERG